MTTYGITNTGFNKKTQDVILEELQTEAQSSFGSNIDLSDNGVLGSLFTIFSYALFNIWNVAEGVYNSLYQNTAEGVPLDGAMELTNNSRLNAIKSSVIATITGDVGTLIEAGFRASISSNKNAIFETLSNYTIPSGGSIDVNMQAIDYGDITSPAGELTVIETPIYGVASITNANDGTIGRDIETDDEFKLRAKNEKQKSGTSPVEGIRKAILELDNIVQCIVNQNVENTIDIDGRPPKSIEAVVQGGDEDEIAQAIMSSKSGGIKSFGSITKNIVDSQGIIQVINFNRPTLITIYVIVNITQNTDINEGALYPSDGDTQIKNAIVEWGANFKIGQDVLKDGAKGIINPINTVAGIREVEVLFGSSMTPTTSTPVAIANNQLASFSLINITVNS